MALPEPRSKFPRTKRGYRKFLQTKFWIDLRQRKLLLNPCCEIPGCGSTILVQPHHVFYRDNWLDTKIEDLQTLCRWHHIQQHPKVKRKLRRRFLKSLRALIPRYHKPTTRLAPAVATVFLPAFTTILAITKASRRRKTRAEYLANLQTTKAQRRANRQTFAPSR